MVPRTSRSPRARGSRRRAPSIRSTSEPPAGSLADGTSRTGRSAEHPRQRPPKPGTGAQRRSTGSSGEPITHTPGRALHLDVAAVLALEGALQLVEGRVLDLPDPLARQVVLVADLAERALLVVAEPEALRQHVGLDRRQVVQEPLDLAGQRVRRHVVLGRVLLGARIGHRIAEAAIVVIVNRP